MEDTTVDGVKLPAPVARHFDTDRAARVTTATCTGCGATVYRVAAADRSHLGTRTECGRETDLWDTGDEYACPWTPGESRHICTECAEDVLCRGRRVMARTATNHRVTVREHHGGVLSHRPHEEYDDVDGHPRSHPLIGAVEALATDRDTIPFPAGGEVHATPGGDRVVEGTECVGAFPDHTPHGLPNDYRAREAFIDAVFAGRVALPTPAVATASHLYVPDGDRELAANRYAAWVEDQYAGGRRRRRSRE